MESKCQNCKALKGLRENQYCELGYKITLEERTIMSQPFQIAVPTESCPNPRTSVEFIQAQKEQNNN